MIPTQLLKEVIEQVIREREAAEKIKGIVESEGDKRG